MDPRERELLEGTQGWYGPRAVKEHMEDGMGPWNFEWKLHNISQVGHEQEPLGKGRVPQEIESPETVEEYPTLVPDGG